MPDLQRIKGFFFHYTARFRSIVLNGAVISSDNNRKANDVISFHRAVDPTRQVGAVEMNVCLTNSATQHQKASTQKTRGVNLFISNYSVFTKVAASEDRKPIMLPVSDSSRVKLSLLLFVPSQLYSPARGYGSGPPGAHTKVTLPKQITTIGYGWLLQDIALCLDI